MRTSSQRILHRCHELAAISDEPAHLTRTYGSPAMARANQLLARWMRDAGMKTHTDAIGNLLGHYPAARPGAKRFLLGSHLDTVRNAGKFDGPLGVLLALACVEHLHRNHIRLPFALDLVAFCDEEGVRFQTAYLGSKVLTGQLTPRELRRTDARGVSLRKAITDFGGDPTSLRSARLPAGSLLGYLEAHIEQGPQLEENNLPLGVVTGIVGQTRARLRILGRAGHAGTTPMKSRRDALCAAAEVILAAERLAKTTPGLVATVGEISALPGASNVIPGEVLMTIDIRHPLDSVRVAAYRALLATVVECSRRRRLQLRTEIVQSTPAVSCSDQLSSLLATCVKRRQKRCVFLPSGAGHDAAVMANLTPTAMLFIRCRGGISHHPDESVKPADVQLALEVMLDFLQHLAKSPHERR